jgi:cytosine/adenosine deaminase-related metal-dependent hydrolase
MSAQADGQGSEKTGALVLCGARMASGPDARDLGSITISRGRIVAIEPDASVRRATRQNTGIDLTGFLLLPGLINSHDHLEFSLFPRLGRGPYNNYIEWGEDIHKRFPETIAKHRTVPKEVRLWWGGIRNLLCGATTVCHHNPLFPELRRRDFPIRIVQHYGWAHSLALGGDLRAARRETPAGCAFIIHACEGTDHIAREELRRLDALDLLDENAVIVHGLAIERDGLALMKERRASLIACPSSNEFLFERLPDLHRFREIQHVALGNDSPLTATGDLLDEIRFAVEKCKITPLEAYRMVTTIPAKMLRLNNAEGSIKEGGVADLIAVRDGGDSAADRLATISIEDIELVLVAGRVHLVSEAMLDRIPSSAVRGLEPLFIGNCIRWLRAPVGDLVQRAREALGSHELRMSGRAIRSNACVEVRHAG